MVTPLHRLRYHYLPLFAKAVKGLFPRVDLLGGGLTDHGFFYDLSFDNSPVDQNVIQSIEERMSQLLYEGVEFSYVEMLRDIAAGCLASCEQGSKARALKLKYSPGLMGFLKVDGFLEYLPDAIDPIDCGQLKHFSLLEVVGFPGEGGNFVTRIEGTAFFTSKELKQFKKKKKKLVGLDHLSLAKEMKLYHYNAEQGEGIWLPKGVEWQRLFFDRWKNFCSTFSVQEIKTIAYDEVEFLEKADLARRALAASSSISFGEILSFEASHQPENCRGMWRLNRWVVDRALFFIKWDDVQNILISSLQFILKTVNILGSDCCWVVSCPTMGPSSSKHRGNRFVLELQKALEFCGISYSTEIVEGEGEWDAPRAYCLLADGLGGSWKGPFISVGTSPLERKEADDTIVSCSIFGSIERIAASMLEHYKGEIPLIYAPEQVRLAAMPSQGAYAQSIGKRLRDEGFRVGIDFGENPLAEKIHSAEKEKVPYIAVVGDREMQTDSLAIRRSRIENIKQRSVAIDDFLDELRRETREVK